MGRRIVIDPVTRIEGHAKITIQLDDAGEVLDARLHVTELRGFEKFCEGRSFREMPAITARICGICPVSHLLASAKAGDRILAVEVPEPARLLRRLVNLAQLVQSHALSFFHLSSPDLLLGFDADPARRNLLALASERPEVARDGVRLRRFGQEAIEVIAGKRIHPEWAVPGGVARPLSPEGREHILAGLPDALRIAQRTLEDWKRGVEAHREEARVFGSFPSLFLGMVGEDGALEHTDGRLRFVDATGKIVADGIDPARWREWIGEAAERDSYMKSPFFKPLGHPTGMYRVGPLARLNVATRCGTPLADAELAQFRELGRGAVLSSFHAHHARLVEILYALEAMTLLLQDPLVLSKEVRAVAARNRAHGVGACEAPRGMLFHDYQVDEGGLLTRVELLVATGQNGLAMNQAITQIARHYLSGGKLREGLLNRVEAGIRAFDPCLSCSTHAAGKMPLLVEIVAPDGALLDRVERTP
jgi:NAD-reducing hydrogenase large subunit